MCTLTQGRACFCFKRMSLVLIVVIWFPNLRVNAERVFCAEMMAVNLSNPTGLRGWKHKMSNADEGERKRSCYSFLQL